MYSIFERMLQARGMTVYKFCKETGVSESTIYTWKKKNSKCSPKLAETICDYFGITIDYLMTGIETDKRISELNKRDEKDIAKQLAAFREQLESQEGLMFDGDPASPEAIESILSAMQIGMELAKKKNKERFTPKKYRKKDVNNDDTGKSR